MSAWNKKYHAEAKRLNVMIGNLGHSKRQVLNEITLKKRHNDNLQDDYPYGRELLDKHQYTPLSFVEFKFGKIIRKSKTEKKVYEPDGF